MEDENIGDFLYLLKTFNENIKDFENEIELLQNIIKNKYNNIKEIGLSQNQQTKAQQLDPYMPL